MSDFPRVTPREQQILDVLLEGRSTPQIAEALNMSQRTVKAHLAHLFLRFGLADSQGAKRVQLAMMVHRHRSGKPWQIYTAPENSPQPSNESLALSAKA